MVSKLGELDKYYKSRVHASSVIVLLKCKAQQDGFDYKILLMKRSPGIVFGGFFAFSGGKVEMQDLYEEWTEKYPEMFQQEAQLTRKYHDFNARLCAIRETFEECSLLIVKPLNNSSFNSSDKTLRDLYKTKFNSNFLDFCKSLKVIPDFDQLYGYRRVSTGTHILPGLDNQFYLYFAEENSGIEKCIDLEPNEFTEQMWLTPQEALDKSYQQKVPMLIPQLICFLHISLIKSFDQLQTLARTVFDVNLISYSSISFELRDISKLPKDMREKAVQYFCNDYDLRSDEEKKDLHTITNPYFSSLNTMIASKQSNFKELSEIYENLLMFTLPGDFFDINDGYPMLSRKNTRRRVFIVVKSNGSAGDLWNFVRFEFTEDIVDMFHKVHIPVPKL